MISSTSKNTGFWASKKRQEKIISLILFIIAWAGAFIFVVPLVWMITTSLKTPTEIFTIPPKWIPVSYIQLDYETKLIAKASGKIQISKGEEGSRILDIIKDGKIASSVVVPAVGSLLIKNKQTVKAGEVVAELPTTGITKIIKNNDGTLILKIVSKAGFTIQEYNLPRGTKLKVMEGEQVRVGQQLATILPQWRNYIEAWAPKALNETFNTYLLNTCIITFFAILGVVLSSTFVAYGFARFRFPFRDPLFLLMISTMMIPVQVTMIPTFILFKYLGWIDTFAPLIVPTFFGGGAFNIFLVRQFFMTIPYELDDAAKIDGCNYFQILYIILLPLVKPALITIAIFGFVYNWNDFLNPLIYLNSSSKYTLALGLQTFTTMYGSYYHLMMAASTIVLLPVLIIFFLGQRYFIEGVATSGLKG